ncbi:hypothetical protein DPEC_G00346000 [Dallia pectoralis]|uniref:Uncharacterized protein n=1 Tax=Dallia pectoralis TaxID=75939 RepID=A0ACC2F3P8_DALPE|nr:hypothetical protein DPEC_G00346000 [Dallia pectoralis]
MLRPSEGRLGLAPRLQCQLMGKALVAFCESSGQGRPSACLLEDTRLQLALQPVSCRQEKQESQPARETDRARQWSVFPRTRGPAIVEETLDKKVFVLDMTAAFQQPSWGLHSALLSPLNCTLGRVNIEQPPHSAWCGVSV